MNMDFSNIVHSVRKTVTEHSPEILTAFGIGGMVTTVVLAVKATPKALDLIENEKFNRSNYDRENAEYTEGRLTPIDYVKVAWKPYIPAMIAGTLSTACLIYASAEGSKRTAAFATAYKLSETALHEYRDAVVETIDKEKIKEINDKMAEKKVEKNNVDTNKIILAAGNGDVLCMDSLTGQTFPSNMNDIKRIEAEFNRSLVINTYLSWNDLLELFGLEYVELGTKLGWNVNDQKYIEFEFGSTIKNGIPCLVIYYNAMPNYNYNTFY